MTASRIEALESNLAARLRGEIAYFADPARVSAVAEPSAVLTYGSVVAPAAIVQWRGEVALPFTDGGTIGLPTDMYLSWTWDVHLIASSFGVAGEGRSDSGAVGRGPGSYRQVDDTFLALAGFQIDPEFDARLVYEGARYRAIIDGRIVYVSSWSHRARRIGVIDV